MDDDTAASRPGWTFLTNHARVLVQISRDPTARIRDIARVCLLTERAVTRIIGDLEHAGYLTHTRVGRSNRYQVTAAMPLRHPADVGHTAADLLAMLAVRGPLADAQAAAEAASDTADEADAVRPTRTRQPASA